MAHAGLLVSPLLVGRDDLLALAERRIAEVQGGQGRFLLLAGEPGVGKSRLMRAILHKAHEAGFRIAKGDLSPHDQLVVLASVEDLARSMDSPDFGALGRQILGVDRGQRADSLGARRRLVRDIVDLVLGSIERPTLLAFEDLQWADEMTLEILAELVRGAERLPLLLVAAYRLDELPTGSIHREWRSRLLTQRLAEEVRLERLTRDETGLVTTLLLGSGLPAPREVVDAVYKRTNGIPLHVEELLAAVGGRATDGRSILGAHVPDTIEDAVLAHVARLSEDAQAIARAGAVLGRCFAPEVVAGILDKPVAALDEGLDELVAAGILFPFEFTDKGYYDFRHQLLRDALYDSVPARDLRRFHARAAEFGASLSGATEIHASVHFERAGMRDQAFRAALGAAEAATKVSSHREALDLYRRAIQNVPASLPDSERARVFMAYANAAGALDLSHECRDAATRARELAQRANDAVVAVEALASLYAVSRREGEPLADRRDLDRRLWLEVEALPDGKERAFFRCVALQFLAVDEIDSLRLADGRRYFEEALTEGRAAHLDGETRDIEMSLAILDIIEGRVSEGLDVIEQTAVAARASGSESAAVGGYRDMALWAARSLDYNRAAVHLAEGLKYAEEIEQSFCGHVMASTQAMVSWAQGRWSDAAAEGAQALSDPGSGRSRAMAGIALGYVAACRGDREVADTHLGAAFAFGRRSDVLEWTLPARWGLAEAALVAGDTAGAIAHCEESLSDARQRGEWGLLAPFAVTGVRAYQAAGRPEAAAKWLGQIERAIGPLAEVAAPAIQHATGLVRLNGGSIVAARTALESAVHLWDERGRRWEALWARLDLAAADLRANRYVDAMVLIREVRDAANELGSRPLLVRADQLERLAKGRGAELEPWHPLTVREFEVAQHVAEGLTNNQIAAALFVSPKTVSAHVEHILAKLGVARRTEIATWVASISRVPGGTPVSLEMASPR